ncbi:hypothetical protein KEJ26_06990 [Candidatus Bathyarchaeota archaeon]|nr:hypothetical protein [Candidatus Bathyarchaeota archaeon]
MVFQKENLFLSLVLIAIGLILFLNIRWISEPIFSLFSVMIILAVIGLLFVLTGQSTSFSLHTSLVKLFRYTRMKLMTIGRSEVNLFQTLSLDSAKLLHGKFLAFKSGSMLRLLAAIQLTGRPKVPEVEIDRSGRMYREDYISTFYKFRDLLAGLQKFSIPCIYMVSLTPIPVETRAIKSKIKDLESEISDKLSGSKLSSTLMQENIQDKKTELQRLFVGKRIGFFQTGIFFFLWADGKAENMESLITTLEAHVGNLTASLFAVFPEMEMNRLVGVELMEAISSFFFPTGEVLPPTSS